MKIELIDDRGKWRKRDRDYFKLLSSTRTFRDLIKKARQEIGLNEERLPKNFETGKLYAATQEYSRNLIDLYDLSEFWEEPLRFFIATGKMPSPGQGIYLSGLSIEFNPSRDPMRPSSFKIEVSEKMGYTNIIKFVNQNKQYIQNYLDKLPNRRSKINNAEIKLDVYKLYEEKVPVSEIAQFLVNKYDISVDEQTIWNWIRRMNQALFGKEIK